VPRCRRGLVHAPRPRPHLEVADIFRHHGAAYRQRHALSREQRATMRAIETCRTPARGGHLDVCDTCGYARPAYNSCRNRHCLKCEALREARWIEARMARLLPSHYFHVVFTLPAELRPLVLRNRRRCFALLFRAASRSLLTLGLDPRRLGARLGVTAVLHTWTRDLQFHPHLHCLVTGGRLAADGTCWIRARRHHLLPVRVLSRLFRGKVLAALTREVATGRLDLADGDRTDPRAFARLKHHLYRQDWVVYAKRPFAGAPQLFRYLGRYTHRVGLANHRLLAVDDTAVRFATKHGRSVRLPPAEFIRRFLLHVLAARFVKIRHFGLFAPGRAAAAHRDRARRLLGAPPLAAPHEDWRTLLRRLTGIDLTRCPRCQHDTMIATPLAPQPPFAHERAAHARRRMIAHPTSIALRPLLDAASRSSAPRPRRSPRHSPHRPLFVSPLAAISTGDRLDRNHRATCCPTSPRRRFFP